MGTQVLERSPGLVCVPGRLGTGVRPLHPHLAGRIAVDQLEVYRPVQAKLEVVQRLGPLVGGGRDGCRPLLHTGRGELLQAQMAQMAGNKTAQVSGIVGPGLLLPGRVAQVFLDPLTQGEAIGLEQRPLLFEQVLLGQPGLGSLEGLPGGFVVGGAKVLLMRRPPGTTSWARKHRRDSSQRIWPLP